MKPCPHCAEEIDSEAVKCPFCREFVDDNLARPGLKKAKKAPWYFSKGWLIAALLSVGPLGLPLLWFNPRYKPLTKILWSIVIVVLSYFLIKATYKAVDELQTTYQQLQDLYYPMEAAR